MIKFRCDFCDSLLYGWIEDAHSRKNKSRECGLTECWACGAQNWRNFTFRMADVEDPSYNDFMLYVLGVSREQLVVLRCKLALVRRQRQRALLRRRLQLKAVKEDLFTSPRQVDEQALYELSRICIGKTVAPSTEERVAQRVAKKAIRKSFAKRQVKPKTFRVDNGDALNLLASVASTREFIPKRRRLAIPQGNEKAIDSTGPQETTTIDDSNKVIMVSQRDSVTTSLIANPTIVQDQMLSFGDEGACFPELTSRWNKIASFDWTTDDGSGVMKMTISLPIELMSILKNNPTMLPLTQYAYMIPQMSVRCFMNSSAGFHEGMLILGFRYYSEYDHDKCGPEAPQESHALLQLPHVLLNAATSNTGEIEIPFVSFMDMIGTCNTSASRLYLATLYIGVFDSLKTVEGSDLRISCALYTKLSIGDAHTRFYGLRSRYAVAEFFLFDAIQGVARGIGSGARALSTSPIFSWIPGIQKVGEGIGLASEGVDSLIGAVSNLAVGAGRFFGAPGGDKPNDPLEKMPILSWSSPSLSSGRGIGVNRPMRLDARCLTPFPPKLMNGEDQMTAAYIKKIWGFVDYINLTSDSVVGSVLKQGVITPVMYNKPSSTKFGKGQRVQLTPVGYLSLFYTYFSGDLEMRIMAVKTLKQSFRLRFCTSPDVDITAANYIDFPGVIFDFQENCEFVVTLPYYGPITSWPIWETTDSDLPTPMGCGKWAIILETSLVYMPAVPKELNIYLMVRASDNFKMDVPRPFAGDLVDTALNVGWMLRNKTGRGITWVLCKDLVNPNITKYEFDMSLVANLKDGDSIVLNPTQYCCIAYKKFDDWTYFATNPNEYGGLVCTDDSYQLDTVVGTECLRACVASTDMFQCQVSPGVIIDVVGIGCSAIPEMEERMEETNKISPLSGSTVAASTLHFGEVFDLKAVCRRPFLVYRDGFSLVGRKRQRYFLPVNFNHPQTRTAATTISLMHGLHDCFRFSRGSISYMIIVESNVACTVQVYHIVAPKTVESTVRKNTAELDFAQYSTMMVASEVCVNRSQLNLPVTIPYYSNVNYLVNGFNEVKSSLLGPRVHSNGTLLICITPWSDGCKGRLDLYQAMGDDAHMMQFQGTPHVVISTNDPIVPSISRLAKPEMLSLAMEAAKSYGTPIIGGLLVARNWKNITDTCTNLSTASNMLLDSLTSTVEAVKGLPSTISQCVIDVFNYMVSGCDMMGSMLAHLYSLIKSSELEIKLAAVCGLLCTLGLVKVCSYFDIYGKIKSLFTSATPEDDTDDKSIMWVTSFLAVVGGALGAAAEMQKGYLASARAFFKDFVWTVSNVGNFLKRNIDMVLDFIYTLAGKQNPQIAALSLFKDKEEEMKVWAENILWLTSSFKVDEVMTDRKLQGKVVELFQQSCKYVVAAEHIPKEAKNSLRYFHNKISTLYDKIGHRVGAGYTSEPVCIWVSGEARIGKSSAVKRMCVDLGLKCGIVYDGQPYFSISASAKHWNGYYGQPFVIWDDFGQVRESSVSAQLLLDFFGLMSCIEYNPSQALLEDKTRLVNSDIAVVTSNILNPGDTFPQLFSKVAFTERIDAKLYIMLSREFKAAYPGVDNFCDPILLENGFFDSEMYSELRYMDICVLDPSKTYTPETAAQGTLYTYAEWLELEGPKIAKRFASRKKKGEADSKLCGRLSVDSWTMRLGEDTGISPTLRQVVADQIKKDNSLQESISNMLRSLGLLSASPQADEQDDESCHSCSPEAILINHEEMPGGQMANICLHQLMNADWDWCETCEQWTSCHEYPVREDTEERVLKWGVPCGAGCVFHQDLREKRLMWNIWWSRHLLRYKGLGTVVVTLPTELQRKKAQPPRKMDGFLNCIKGIAQTFWDCIPVPWRVLSVVLNIACSLLTYILVRTAVHSAAEWVLGENIVSRVVGNVSGHILGYKWAERSTEPEIASSGDVSTAGVASRTVQVTGKLARAQMSRDLNRIIYRNTVYVTIADGEVVRTVQGKGIAERIAIFPAHLFEALKEVKECKVLTFGQSEVGAVQLVDYKSLSITRVVSTDLVIVGFPKRIPCFRNILGLLPTQSQVAMCGGTHSYMLETPIGSASEQVIRVFERVRPVSNSLHYELRNGAMAIELLGWEYPYHRQGLCGNVLVDEKHQKIIAMHVCACDDMGMAQVLCRDWFDTYNLTIQDVEEPELQDSEDSILKVPGDYIPLGKLAEAECAPTPVKTSIVKSSAFEVLGPASRFPLQFTVKGEPKPCYTKLAQACEVGVNPTLPFDAKDIAVVARDLRMEILAKAKPIVVPQSDRGIAGAIQGLPGVPFMDPMKMATSPGWPLNARNPGKKKSHYVLFEDDSGYREVTNIHTDLHTLYVEQNEKRRNKVIPFTPYFDFLKDERRKPGKSARLINGCSFMETIDFRRYMLDFWAAYQSAGLEVGSAIGINPRSMDWTRLANKLLANSDKILVGDFKNFGPTLDPDVMATLLDVVEEWYATYCPSQEEDNNVRRTLLEGLLQVTHVSGDLVMKTVCGQPSGCPITAPMNTYVNRFYKRLAWLDIFRGSTLANMQSYNKYVVDVDYGDDTIFSVAEIIIDKFNNRTISEFFEKHGIVYTDALKDGTMREFCSLSEATFLKHHFVEHPTRVGVYNAALEKSVIVDIPSWIRTPCIDEVEQVKVSMDCAIRFAYSWGPEYYRLVRDTCESWCRKRNEMLHSLTWEQIDSVLYDTRRGINVVTEDLFELYSLTNLFS